MREEIVKLYKELLFSFSETEEDLKTYAIVDSLRAKNIKKELLISNLNYVDLWHEELMENELKTPLYLIELDKENAITSSLLKNHKDAVATYFTSPYDLNTLKNYYVPLTYIDIEVEEDIFDQGLFGFYDPHVLSNYIETLHNQEKIDEFFAPVAFWLTPSIEDELSAHFSFKFLNKSVKNVSRSLRNFIDEKDVQIDFSNILVPHETNVYPVTVNIDKLQVKMFDNMQVTVFVNKLLREFKEDNIAFPERKKGEVEYAHELFEEANKLEIQTEAGMYHYLLMGLSSKEPLSKYQFYYDIKDSSNEFEKINIMNETIALMRKD